MGILLQVFLLIFGFVLLIKGADFFVDGASNTAQNFKVPKLLIGLTIVAFGTSAPELAVSIKALSSGNSDIVLGNVIGSNIFNILLILGVAAIIRPVRVRRRTVRKELPFCLLLSILLVVLMLDKALAGLTENSISRADGVVVLLFFAVFAYYLVRSALRHRTDGEEESPEHGLLVSLSMIGAGLAGVIIGSNLAVDAAVAIAEFFGVSARVISLTIIAFGTSLPELVTTIVAARKGEQDLLVGNIVGSNIFNIAVVLGVPTVIFGGANVGGFSSLDLFAFIAAAVILFGFSLRGRKITRANGIAMLVVFALYYGGVVFLS